jgi:hypothetical protein
MIMAEFGISAGFRSIYCTTQRQKSLGSKKNRKNSNILPRNQQKKITELCLNQGAPPVFYFWLM